MTSGRPKWAWITAIPLTWDATVTLTASRPKLFSSGPPVGFFERHSVHRDGIDRGEAPAPVKSTADLHTIVTNSTVDGFPPAILALLIALVTVDAARGWIRQVRRPARSPLGAVPYAESNMTGMSPVRARTTTTRRHPRGARFERMRTGHQ